MCGEGSAGGKSAKCSLSVILSERGRSGCVSSTERRWAAAALARQGKTRAELGTNDPVCLVEERETMGGGSNGEITRVGMPCLGFSL